MNKKTSIYFGALFVLALAIALYMLARRPGCTVVNNATALHQYTTVAPPSTIATASGVGERHEAKQLNSDGQARPTSLTNAAGFVGQINNLINAGKYLDALAVAERALSSSPSQDERERLLLYKGNLLMALNRFPEAWTTLTELIETARQTEIIEGATLKCYVAACALGKLGDLLSQLQREYQDDPNDVRLARVLADLYAYSGQRNEEIRMRESIAAHQRDPANLQHLAQAYAEQERYSAAAAYSEELARTDAASAPVYLLQKARYEMNAGRFDDAARTCQRLLEHSHTSGEILLKAGYLLSDMKCYEEALRAFAEAERKVPEDFQKQRCGLEICRMHITLDRIGPETRTTLEKLANDALADGVKRDASILLQNFERKGN